MSDSQDSRAARLAELRNKRGRKPETSVPSVSDGQQSNNNITLSKAEAALSSDSAANVPVSSAMSVLPSQNANLPVVVSATTQNVPSMTIQTPMPSAVFTREKAPVTISNEFTEQNSRLEARHSAELERLRRENEEAQQRLTTQFQKIIDDTRVAALTAEQREKENSARLEVRLGEEKVRIMNELQAHAEKRIVEERKVSEERLQKRELDFQREREQQEATRKQLIQKISALESIIAQNESEKATRESSFSREKLDAIHDVEERLKAQFAEKLELVHAETASLIKANDELRDALAARDREAEKALIELRHRLTEERQDAERAAEQQNQQTIIMYKEAAAKALQEADEARAVSQAASMEADKKVQLMREECDARVARAETEIIKRAEAERNAYYRKVEEDSAQIIQNMKEIMEKARSDLKNEQEKNAKRVMALEKTTLEKMNQIQTNHSSDIAKHTVNLRDQYEARIKALEQMIESQKRINDEKIAQMVADHRMALETMRRKVEEEYAMRKANLDRENEKLATMRESLTEDQTKFRAVLKEEYMKVAQEAVDREKQILANARTQICDLHRAELEKFLKSDVQIKYGDEIIARCVENIRSTCTDVMGKVTLECAKLSAKDAQEFGNKFTDDILAQWLEDLQVQRKNLIEEARQRSELFVADINNAWTQRMNEYNEVVKGVEKSLKQQEEIRAELKKAESVIMLDARAQIEAEREQLTKRIAEIENEKIKFQAECIKTSQDANNEAEKRALEKIEEQSKILLANYATQQKEVSNLRNEIQQQLMDEKARLDADYLQRLADLDAKHAEYVKLANDDADAKIQIMQRKLDEAVRLAQKETEDARKTLLDGEQKLAEKEIEMKSRMQQEQTIYEKRLRTEILVNLLEAEREKVEDDLAKRRENLKNEHDASLDKLEKLRHEIVFDERAKYEKELQDLYSRRHTEFLQEQKAFFDKSASSLKQRSDASMAEIEARERVLQAQEAENSKKWLNYVETEVQRRYKDLVETLEKQFKEREMASRENLKKDEIYLNEVYLKQKLDDIEKQRAAINNEIETRLLAYKRTLAEDYSRKEAECNELVKKRSEEMDAKEQELRMKLNQQREDMKNYLADEEKRFIEKFTQDKKTNDEQLAKTLVEREAKWRTTYDTMTQQHAEEIKTLTETLERTRNECHDKIRLAAQEEARKRDEAIETVRNNCEIRVESEKKRITGELTQKHEAEVARIRNEMTTEHSTRINNITKTLNDRAAADIEELRNKLTDEIIIPLRNKLEKEHKEYEESITDLKLAHQDELAKLETTHRTEMTQQRLSITEEFENRINKLKDEHVSEIKRLSDSHATAINQLQAANKTRVDELVANHDDYIRRLKQNNADELLRLQAKHDAAMQTRTKEQTEFETSLREKTNDTLSKIQRDCEARIVEARRERDDYRDRLLAEKNEEVIEIKKQYEQRLAEDLALRDRETKRITDEMNSRAQAIEAAHIERTTRIEEDKRTFERNLTTKFNKEREEATIAEAQRNAEALEKQIAEKEEMHKQLSAAKQAQHYAELQLRKAKHAAMLWRMDYHDTLRKHYDNLLGTLEARLLHTREEEDRLRLQQRQREASENVRIREIEMKYTTEIENIVRKNQIEKDATFAAQARKDEEDAKNARELDGLKRKLREMWHELQTTDGEIAEFLNALVDKAPGREQIDFAQTEADRLTDMLPIVRLVDQREFALNRLREFVRNATNPSRFFDAPSSRLMLEDKQRKDIMESIKTISSNLIPKVREYERRFERSFIYKGVNYLEIMENDVQNIERNAEVSNMKGIAKKIVGANMTTSNSLLLSNKNAN